MSPREKLFNLTTGQGDNESSIDEKSFEVFFRDNFVRFCVYCQYKFGFDTHLAKEVVHTAFIKLWESRDKTANISSLLPYFQRIVYNNCLDTLKHDKVRLQYKNSILKDPKFDIESSPFSAIDIKQLQSDINSAIAELPAQMQVIFKMSRFDGFTYAEIAKQLNISVKTIETQMSRALVKLKKSLGIYLNHILVISLMCQKIFY